MEYDINRLKFFMSNEELSIVAEYHRQVDFSNAVSFKINKLFQEKILFNGMPPLDDFRTELVLFILQQASKIPELREIDFNTALTVEYRTDASNSVFVDFINPTLEVLMDAKLGDAGTQYYRVIKAVQDRYTFGIYPQTKFPKANYPNTDPELTAKHCRDSGLVPDGYELVPMGLLDELVQCAGANHHWRAYRAGCNLIKRRVTAGK